MFAIVTVLTAALVDLFRSRRSLLTDCGPSWIRHRQDATARGRRATPWSRAEHRFDGAAVNGHASTLAPCPPLL